MIVKTPDSVSDIPTDKEMENLFVNNEELEQIETYLNRFNPIKIMKMERMEIRHSAILAWLLDPNETHGLSDRFLRAFLSEALKGTDSDPSAVLVSESDLRYAEVLREKNNIDLFVNAPHNGWAFIIENKLDSRQHSNQLTRYMDAAKKEAKEQGREFKFNGILLTLDEEAPHDNQYMPLRYSEVSEILTSLLNSFGAQIDPQAKQFIEDYLDVIGDLTGMNNEQLKLEDLAKQLYRTHKKALEFVMDHGRTSGFSAACDAEFGDNLKKGDIFREKYIYNRSSPTRFGYIPITWKEILETDELAKLNIGCEDWQSGCALSCWFDLRTNEDGVKGKLFLNFEVGPIADSDLRLQLVQALSQISDDKHISLSASAKRSNAKFSKFLKSNSKTIPDVGDSEVIRQTIEQLTNKFAPTIDAVEEALVQFSNENGAKS